MYNDLADAVEQLEEEGVRNLSHNKHQNDFLALMNNPDMVSQTSILGTYTFDECTDPGDEATLYILQLPEQKKGYLILGFGKYQDPEKADLIDMLKELEK